MLLERIHISVAVRSHSRSALLILLDDSISWCDGVALELEQGGQDRFCIQDRQCIAKESVSWSCGVALCPMTSLRAVIGSVWCGLHCSACVEDTD